MRLCSISMFFFVVALPTKAKDIVFMVHSHLMLSQVLNGKATM
jgi:hypothetical protein